MAGGGWKGTGGVLLVLGGLLVAVGLTAVIVGSSFVNDGTHGPFSDRDKARAGADIVAGGLAGLAAGGVLLVLGAIFLAIGDSAARREDQRIAATMPAGQARPPAPARPASSVPVWVIPVIIAGIVLVVAFASLNAREGGSPLSLTSGASTTDSETFQGQIQGAYPAPSASDAHEWTPKVATRTLTVSYKVSGSTVTGSTHLLVEAFDGQSWRAIQTMTESQKTFPAAPATKLRFTAAFNDGVNGPGVGTVSYEVAALATS